MNKDLETINKTVNEIREILNAECAPIDQLPEMVNDLSQTATKSGFTTAFIFSTKPNPNMPTGGSLDTTTGLVVGIEDDWSQSINIANPTNIHMSFAVFNPEGEKTTEWSTPVNLKGVAGIGVPGDQGPQGPAGVPGEKGEAGVSYRVVQVYTTTASVDTTPGYPRGGHWDMKTNTLSLPVSDDGTRWWANIDDDPNPKLFLWTSNVTFMDNGNPIGKWSTPIRLNGADGKNGVDGNNIEFIYRLLPDYDSYLLLKNHLSANELPSPNENKFVPDNNDSLNVGTEWENHPTGIDENMKVEVVCVRTKTADEPWSKWSNCTIWSKWGEDGMDGDGVEYIYLVTPAEINGIPTTSGHVKDTMVPTYSLDGDYQKDEFCFNDEWGFEGYDWTDEPRDVGPGEPMEWVMVRKQKDGVWQSFSDPALWATYSESGVSYITSFVFARGNVNNPPARPEGGDYRDPKPNGNVWSDTVPSDSNLPVWMSTRVFCSTSEYSDDDWSEPKMLTDTPDFQVEYSAYKGEITREKISKFEGDSTEENEERWRAYQLSEYEIEWGDDTKIKNPVWMITATRHGGIWSDWTISKIKGEKGDKGEPGSSVKIEGEFETLDQLKTAWNKYVTTGDLSDFGFYSEDGIINQGDGWYIKNEGKLYSYSGGWTVGEPNTNFDKYWFGVDIKGKPGDNAYIYIAYCNENVATATVDLIGPGKYIGISTKDLSEEDRLKWSSYTWTKWEGEDGWGYEQIFLATSKDLDFDPENNHLPIPTNNEQTPEYLPPHTYGNLAYPSDKWSDTPILNENYPFCWVVTRKVNGTIFGDWKGRDGKAALYSRYSYDGVSNVFVDLSNDLAVIPMENGKVDPDFIGPVETVVRVYVGDEEIESSKFTVTGKNVTVNGATVTLNLSALTSNIKTIPLNVKLGDKTYTVNWKILQTDVAYELTPKTYSIRRYTTGEKIGQLEFNELTVDIWKWSDNKWTATNIPLFAYVVYTNGNDETFSTEDRIAVANNGVATINLRGLLNVASIKIYVVAQNEDGEYDSRSIPVSFENIAIVADGEPGPQGNKGDKGDQGDKGDKGDKGDDGKSISIKGHFDTLADLQLAWSIYFSNNSADAGFVYPLIMGDGYLVEGDLWIYDGNGSDFADAWYNVGKIQGEPGQSMYIAIRYSNNADGSDMVPEGQFGKYIGIAITDHELTDVEKVNPDTYAPWQKWTGDDGWGWEQMFTATANYSAPYFPSSEDTLTESELIDKYSFSDKPIDTDSKNNKYIWYWTRKTNSAWQGASTTDGKIYAALYTRWVEDGQAGKDGNGIVSVTKLFAVNNDPKNHPTSGWTEDMPSTSSENRYLWCEETTTYTKSSSTTIHYIVAVHGEPGASSTGNDAPIIYPAGIWDNEKAYKVEADKVPYVFYAEDNTYYMLNHEYLFMAEGESEWKGSNSAPGKTYEEQPIWLPIDSFEAIYSDIGMFNQALVGKWVFHGDYMFSQEGVLGQYSGNKLIIPQYNIKSGEQCTYSELMGNTIQGYSTASYNQTILEMNLWQRIENEIWIPNVLFNAVTGEGWFAGKKIQFNIDGSGSLGNGITWNNTGDITIEGSIFNPVVNATSSNCLNKTVCVSGDLRNPTLVEIGPYVTKTSDISIKRIGSVVVTSLNLESPTYVTFVGASLQVSKIHTDKNDAVVSQNNTYNSFIISPGATVTFDVFDDYTNEKRYLRPQIQMGWFNRLGTVLPCTFNSIDYLDISAVKHTPQGIGSSMEAGQFYELISLPENLVKYMSLKFNSLNDEYNDSIYFDIASDGISTSSYAISNFINETGYVRNAWVPFREGGSFGIGAYGVSPSISNDAHVDICLYDSNTMIGWFGFNI